MNSDSDDLYPRPLPEDSVRAQPMIESAPLPMVEVEGPEHRVCSVNQPFCRLLHRQRAELIGQPFSQLVRNVEKCEAVLNRIYETGEFETHVDADGTALDPACWLYAMWPTLGADKQPERVVIQLTKSPFLESNAVAMNEALLISGLRQHELREEAEQSNARAHDEIARRMVTEVALRDLVGQLRTATDAAVRANQAKDRFLAFLSHELRTPLTPVLIAAAELREDKSLPRSARERAGMIEQNVALEARLIDDLLDLTKISNGKMQLGLAACDAHVLIGLAVETVRSDAQEKEIELECTFEARRSGLTADPARFQQVIWNLLRNAVKFTPRGGRISIRSRDESAAGAEGWLRIEVADTGIGIDPPSLERIFLPFDQGTVGGRQGGIGLGLAIARAVVELHHGRITAVSVGADQGSTFTIQLLGAFETRSTAADTVAPFPVKLPRAPKMLRSFRLLLVEDHTTTLRVLTHFLKQDGHQVVAAASQAEALRSAASNEFDLVISDLGLPDGTGNELMAKLRATYGLRGIALSGYGMEADIARSKAAGFVSHLIKPVTIAELRRVLASLELASE